jgi:hypothetical protein
MLLIPVIDDSNFSVTFHVPGKVQDVWELNVGIVN